MTIGLGGGDFHSARRAAIHRDLVRAVISRIDRQADLSRIERWFAERDTPAYRYNSGASLRYLKFGDSLGSSLGAEALILRKLRKCGVDVPNVIHFEELAPEVSRSVLVTTYLQAEETIEDVSEERPHPVFLEAGRQCAIINQQPCERFGQVRRSSLNKNALSADFETYTGWFDFEYFDRRQLSQVLHHKQATMVMESLDTVRSASITTASLAHGQMSAQHILGSDNSFLGFLNFTGFIDFRESLGSDRWYDLAYFVGKVDWSGRRGREIARAFIKGYAEVSALSSDDLEFIRHRAISIIARRMLALRRAGTPAYAYDFMPNLLELSEPGRLDELITP